MAGAPHPSAADAFDELVTLLRPRRQGASSFRGAAPQVQWGVPYGGLLVAQAVAAASASVPDGLWIRSLHAYMVQVGVGSEAVDIDVHRVHDGRSSAWRSVEVIQHERLLLRMDALFATDAEGPSHQAALPAVPGPETLPNVGAALASYDDTFRPWDERSPFDLRYVTAPPRLNDSAEARTTAWIGASAPPPPDRALAGALLAYASDLCMLDSSLQPHGLWFGEGGASGFSLDHSMWFHAPARADDWILMDQRSPGMRDGRALGTADLYARDGELLATVSQLGSIRAPRAPRPAKETR